MQARWMMPELGRFISPDPARDGLNWYIYCSNNPTTNIDPTGLYAEDYGFGYTGWSDYQNKGYDPYSFKNVGVTIEAPRITGDYINMASSTSYGLSAINITAALNKPVRNVLKRIEPHLDNFIEQNNFWIDRGSIDFDFNDFYKNTKGNVKSLFNNYDSFTSDPKQFAKDVFNNKLTGLTNWAGNKFVNKEPLFSGEWPRVLDQYMWAGREVAFSFDNAFQPIQATPDYGDGPLATIGEYGTWLGASIYNDFGNAIIKNQILDRVDFWYGKVGALYTSAIDAVGEPFGFNSDSFNMALMMHASQPQATLEMNNAAQIDSVYMQNGLNKLINTINSMKVPKLPKGMRSYDIDKLYKVQLLDDASHTRPSMIKQNMEKILAEGPGSVGEIPIYVNNKGEAILVGGHHRYAAFKNLGYKRVPIKYVHKNQLFKDYGLTVNDLEYLKYK